MPIASPEERPPDNDPFAFARQDERGTARLQAFCDGVFATAGTLLIWSSTSGYP